MFRIFQVAPKLVTSKNDWANTTIRIVIPLRIRGGGEYKKNSISLNFDVKYSFRQIQFNDFVLKRFTHNSNRTVLRRVRFEYFCPLPDYEFDFRITTRSITDTQSARLVRVNRMDTVNILNYRHF